MSHLTLDEHMDEITRLVAVVRSRVRARDLAGATAAKMEIYNHGRVIAKALRTAVLGRSTEVAIRALRMDDAAVRALGEANRLIGRAVSQKTRPTG